MKNYKIEEKVLNATIQYLATRPYAEVVELLNVLRASKPVDGVDEEVINRDYEKHTESKEEKKK